MEIQDVVLSLIENSILKTIIIIAICLLLGGISGIFEQLGKIVQICLFLIGPLVWLLIMGIERFFLGPEKFKEIMDYILKMLPEIWGEKGSTTEKSNSVINTLEYIFKNKMKGNSESEGSSEE